jgi:hypothetical protein
MNLTLHRDSTELGEGDRVARPSHRQEHIKPSIPINFKLAISDGFEILLLKESIKVVLLDDVRFLFDL